jgi:hypothetical protein
MKPVALPACSSPSAMGKVPGYVYWAISIHLIHSAGSSTADSVNDAATLPA